MTLCVFEDDAAVHLAPLSLTRPVFDLRVGARTLFDAIRHAFPDQRLALQVRPEIAGVAQQEHTDASINRSAGDTSENAGVLFVNGSWLVRPGGLLDAVRGAPKAGEKRAWTQGDRLVAAFHPNPPSDALDHDVLALFDTSESAPDAFLVTHLWDLIADLGEQITHDVSLLGSLGIREEASVHDSVLLVHPERIHLAPGATLRPGAILNAEAGPIHVGADAVIEEGAIVRGPVYLGPKAVVKAAGRVETSAIGYWSKVGGEVHESIVHSLSNKAHDGYLGNSYLGRWCNLGADTNTSNLKNDYGEATVWDAATGAFVATGSQFVGLFMGDHSKCSINTMFNTGTVVGVSCNLYGSSFPPRHVPSFSWGGGDGLVPYRLDKALRVADAVQQRRNRPLTDAERTLFAHVFESSTAERDSPHT